MQRQKERKEAMMNKCLNCGVIFQKPKQIEVPDHTGHIDLIIDVCPMCNSNNIQPYIPAHAPTPVPPKITSSLKTKIGNVFKVVQSVNTLLDAADIRHLERMKDLYIKTCSEQKQATSDIDLIRHYSALIQYAEDFHQKIIIYSKHGNNNKS